MGSLGLSWGCLGPPWGRKTAQSRPRAGVPPKSLKSSPLPHRSSIFVSSWGSLELFWGSLGLSWGSLGTLLGSLGALLACLGFLVGSHLLSWGSLGLHLVLSGSLGLSWGSLGALLDFDGALLGPLGALLGLSWTLLVRPRALLGTLGSVLGSLRASKLPRLPWLPGFLSSQASRLPHHVCDRQLVCSYLSSSALVW